MKLVCLNVWGGRVYGPLMDFVRKTEADVFCFQEVFHSVERMDCRKEARANLFSELEVALKGYCGLFAPSDRGRDFGEGVVDFHLEYGQAMFVKEGLPIGEQGGVVLLGEEAAQGLGEMVRVMQYVRVAGVMVCNLHGLWNRGPKGDSPERLVQSERVRGFLEGVEGRVVVCGDFNLNPDTESLAILERTGLRNLVKDLGVKSTRSSYHTFPDCFADYVLVSGDVNVRRFEVLQDQVSDHLPLFLEFE